MSDGYAAYLCGLNGHIVRWESTSTSTQPPPWPLTCERCGATVTDHLRAASTLAVQPTGRDAA